MVKISWFIKKFALFFLVLLLLEIVIAKPLPCEYGGSVSSDGEPIEDGLSVKAYIADNLYAVMQDGIIDSHYQVIIEADDPETAEKEGGEEGDEIIIKIDDEEVYPKLTWTSGEIIRADLTINEECTPKWNCGEWSVCSNSVKTRTCVDSNNCNTNEGKPTETASCTSECVPNWRCTRWDDCDGGEKERTCTDLNDCGTDEEKPREEKDCNDDDDEEDDEESDNSGGLSGGGGTTTSTTKINESSENKLETASKKINKELAEDETDDLLPLQAYYILGAEPKENLKDLTLKSLFIILTIVILISVCCLIIYKKVRKIIRKL